MVKNYFLSLSLLCTGLLLYAQNSKLSGTYTIGSSGTANYATFAAAALALQSGIEESVVFQVEAGSYPENVVIPDVNGTSATKTITFKSASGNNTDVKITGTGGGGQDASIFKINGADYVTIENISFIPTNQSFRMNLHLCNMSRHVTIRNCIFTANLSTDIYGMRHIYTEAINEEGKNNDFITVENCTITGGYIGLYIGGTSYVALTKEEGAILRNNILSNQGSKGIYVYDEKDALIENNIIISANTTKNDYWGIDIFRSIGNMIIRNNKINISQPVYSSGIFIRTDAQGTTETPLLVYNNSISITNARPSTYGIQVTSDCSFIKFYYNTIRLEGTGGYCFGVNSNYSDIEGMLFQNNLLQHYSSTPLLFFRNAQHYQSFIFKNNAYYFTGTAFSNGWGDSFSEWIANSGETGSFIEQALFFSSTDLHLQQAGNLKVALPVSFILKDLEGKNRHSTMPTIGAYEYGDVVIEIPEMESGYPQLSTLTHDKVTIKVKLTQSSALHYILRKTSESAPSLNEVQQSNDLVDVDQSVETMFTVSGLIPETEYKMYFAAISVLGAESGLMESAPFTTPKQVFPLEVVLPETFGPVASGASITLTPEVSGGVEPYVFMWKNSKNETLSTQKSLTIKPTVSDSYFFIVKDAENSSLTQKTVVYVITNKSVAIFDDLSLASESAWYGYSGSVSNEFFSGSYSFNNSFTEEWNAWSGFAYSNMTATDFDPDQYITHQFCSSVGHGANESVNYAIVYSMGFQPEINIMHNSDNGDIIQGVYVTNAAWTLHSIHNGDNYMGDPFKNGDYYKVVFTGTSSGGKRSSVEYYLADYRSENEAEHYVLTDWQWIDLSALGVVKSVSMSVEASRIDDWEMVALPAYFCIDDFGSTMPVDVETTLTVSANETETLSLGELFNSFDETIPVVYTILNSSENIQSDIEGSNLNIIASGEGVVLVSATQRSVTKYGKINVETSEFIVDTECKNVISIFPIPVHNILNVLSEESNYQIRVYDLLGKLVLQQNASKTTQISLDQLPSGIYIFETISNEGRFTQKFMKK